MTKLTTKFALLLAVVAAILPVTLATPAGAAALQVAYVSATGVDSNPCTAAQPCATFSEAIGSLQSGGQINCLTPPGPSDNIDLGGTGSFQLIIDCPGGVLMGGSTTNAVFLGSNQTLKLRHMTISGAFDSGNPLVVAVGITGSTLVIEDCVIENESGNLGVSVSPNGPFNLVISNTKIFNTGGILMLPATGGSVTATFDHVLISQNGGGIHTDSRNGAITLNLMDSVISYSTANGVNVSSGPGAGQNNVMTISRSTISNNGFAGIQVGGANAAVLVDNTLLDSNTSGATSAGNGGRVLTYGNNRIVGSSGSGFTGSATLQ